MRRVLGKALEPEPAVDHVDAAAAIARALNRSVPEPPAEPAVEPSAELPIVEPAVEQPAVEQPAVALPAEIAPTVDAWSDEETDWVEALFDADPEPAIETSEPVELPEPTVPATAPPLEQVAAAEPAASPVAPPVVVDAPVPSLADVSPAVPPVAETPETTETPETPETTETTETPEDPGVTVRIDLAVHAEGDPLVEALVVVGASVIYDRNSDAGKARWDAVVIELPPGEPPRYVTRAGAVSTRWTPSLHTRGTIELLAVQLEDADPGAGYDVVVTAHELVVCRWPHRAGDGHEPVPLFETAEPEPVEPPPQSRRRRAWWRRHHARP